MRDCDKFAWIKIVVFLSVSPSVGSFWRRQKERRDAESRQSQADRRWGKSPERDLNNDDVVGVFRGQMQLPRPHATCAAGLRLSRGARSIASLSTSLSLPFWFLPRLARPTRSVFFVLSPRGELGHATKQTSEGRYRPLQ